MKSYTITEKEIKDGAFDPIECADVEDLFGEDFVSDALIFEAGIHEAVNRYILAKKEQFIERDIIMAMLGLKEGEE